MVSMEKPSTASKCSALKVSNRQPGTRTENRPPTLGAVHKGMRNGPAKARRPSVITCPPSGISPAGISPAGFSLAGLAFGVVDGAELRLRAWRRLGRVGAGRQLPAVGGHRVQRARLAGRLLGVRRAHRAQVVGGLEAAQPGE